MFLHVKSFGLYTQGGALGGYALLLSILISSIVLVIAIGLTGLIEKELVLTSSARDSQFAFYAADSGSECGLFWDFKHPGYDGTIFREFEGDNSPTQEELDSNGAFCNNVNIVENWQIIQEDSTSATTRFEVPLSGDTCTIVDVAKTDSGVNTEIESRGQTRCGTTHPRRVERAIRLQF